MAKKSIIAWSPIRALMKDEGAEMVSRDAVDALISLLISNARKVTQEALVFARHAKRKKITKDDIALVGKL